MPDRAVLGFAMEELQSIVYVSSAVRLFSAEEIRHLLDAARKRNQEYGVTGVLLHCDGNFMQYIEGPSAGLDHVYGIICTDSKHRGMIEIMRAPIDRREFGEWSMAYRSPEANGYSGSAQEQHLFGPVAQRHAMDASPSRLLLQNFWTRGLRH